MPANLRARVTAATLDPRRADREVLDGILWILRSGARWCDLPERFAPYQTCHRRFQHWVRDGWLKRVLETLAEDLRTRGGLDLSECFIDGTFVVAKKGAQKSERPSGARVRSSWQWQTALVFLSPSTAPHEVRLVRKTLVEWFTDDAPARLIGDKAYDSDPLDAELAAVGVELIAPHKANRKRAVTQDGRSLRRYKRRWEVERLFAWLQSFRRILVRDEFHDDNYLGFVHLGCMLILLRAYF